jgi:hypothetical protein
LALIVGVLWDDFLNWSKIAKTVDLWVKGSYYFMVIAVLSGAIGIFIYLDHHDKMPGILNGVIISAAILSLGFVVSAIVFARKKYSVAFFLVIISLVVFLIPINLLVLPYIERYETSKEVAQKLKTMIKDGEELGSQSNYLPGLAFYADRFAIDLDNHQMLVSFFNSNKKNWCVIKSKNHEGLYDPAINNEYVKPSYAMYKMGKRTIVTNEVPADGKYLIKREFAK